MAAPKPKKAAPRTLPKPTKVKEKTKDKTKEKAKPDRKRSKSGSEEDRINRLVTVCIRCRMKKVKCDRKLPRCTNCEKSGSECILMDPLTGEHMSRMSVQQLELKLKNATEELEKLRKERQELEQPLMVHNAEFKFGKVLLMKDDDIKENYATGAGAVEIPARTFVEACVELYFALANVQVPILHRDFYLFKYFKPLYGIVGPDMWQRLLGDTFDAVHCTEKHFLDERLDKMHKGKCLFFLYIIIAILTSQHQQKHPLMISNHYKKQAFRYVDYVWNDVEGSDNDLSKLEMLQLFLLLTQYSLMRPCTPGAWYLVGTCVRLCQDLGLHNETVYLNNDDFYIVDMKRRLFWCCYSLDRQISIYFGRQFGIDSRQIDCPFLSTRDDLIINFGMANYNVREWISYEPRTKEISLHYINLRILQGEIFDFIHNVSNRVKKPQFRGLIDPSYEEKVRRHDVWKSQKHADLYRWMHDAPISGHQSLFNEMIFRLNLNQTLIQLYGISAITPVITDEGHLRILYDSGREIIRTYVKLVEKKMINFSWVAINNLYMGATVHLSLISQSNLIRSQVNLQELKDDCAGVNLVFNELCNICPEPAKEYSKRFSLHCANVIELCERGHFSMSDMKKSTSESNIFTSVGGNSITPAKLVAPVPQRSTSMFLQIEEKILENEGNSINDQFLFDNDVFLNNMMGSVKATVHGETEDLDSDELYGLDPDYLV